MIEVYYQMSLIQLNFYNRNSYNLIINICKFKLNKNKF